MVFTKSTSDGVFEIQLHIKDDVKEFPGETIKELAQALRHTADLLDIATKEETAEVVDLLKIKRES